MSNNDYKKLKGLVKNIKKLEIGLPKEADSEYFTNLENKIMKGLDCSCKEVRESLVDLFEGTLSKERTEQIEAHIESCCECKEEYKQTVTLISDLSKINTREEAVDEYFATLADRITEKVFEDKPSDLCETAQDYIVNTYTQDPIPSDIQKHINACKTCQHEIKATERIITNLKRLSMPLPSEQYFNAQLKRIDAAIEMLPAHRTARAERRERITSYVADILNTFRVTIMQPQAAIAVSALVAILIIGGRMYYRQDRIEERQINLSEVMSKTNAVATGINPDRDRDRDRDRDSKTTLQIDTATATRNKYMKENISDPREDEKLELKTTGTAEIKNKNKKLN
ncbi:MAG: zf-HC2 domain-containing protein [Proteobacteria bacterium]|nr:zf-HC2 domain-containing protein [Pseudomonadota bacterium]